MEWVHEGPFGIETFRDDPGLRLYPNPATDALVLDLDEVDADGPLTVEITSALGRTVRILEEGPVGNADRSIHMPLEGLAPGVYQLACSIEGRRLTRSFVKL